MKKRMITGNREQKFLLPPDMKEWLPAGDLAWLVLDAILEMDISGFYSEGNDDEGGRPPYDPEIMVALLVYAYCVGQRSSRQIERLCWRDVGFRVIASNLRPDHATIARFRRDHGKAFGDLFIEVLRLCRKAGLVRVGIVAVDGTKLKANAALDANRTRDTIEAEVQKILSEAEAVDREEDARYGEDKRGDELPEDLQNRTDRLKRLEQCRKQLEEEARAAEEEQKRKAEERKAKETEQGGMLRGRKPKESAAESTKEKKANVTDPESRIMKTRTGYIQGYNAQAAVTEDQIIIAAELTDEANDVRQLHPMLSACRENLKEIGLHETIGNLLADAGYWSETNARKRRGRPGTEFYIATNKDWKQRKALRDLPPPRGRIPEGFSLRDRMERKLLTKIGRMLYKKRSQTVEPVFGQVKDARGIDHFMRRGKLACRSEWKLIGATHNLLKLWRKRAEDRLTGLSDIFHAIPEAA
jgi:transposase